MSANYRSHVIRVSRGVTASLRTMALTGLLATVLLLGGGPRPSYSAPGLDACPEPNDEFQQACELRPNNPLTGVLATDGDVDAYRLEAVDFHARLRVRLTDGRLDHRLSLVNWDGAVVASTDPGARPPGGPVVLDRAVGPPGAYYVFVDTVTGLGEPTAPYRLSLETVYPAGSTSRVLHSGAFGAGRIDGCTASRGPAAVVCAQEGGRFTVEIGAGSTDAEPTAAWLWVGPVVSDFTFTADTRLIRDARNAAIQLDIRGQDYDNGYGVALVPREGLIVLSKSVAGEVTELASASRPDLSSRSGVNRLTVTAIGSALHVTLNGQAVISVMDDAFAIGRVGFFTYTFDEPFAARVDNVLLTTPAMAPCPPPGPGGASAPCPPR